jgi:hypothetical protein
MKSLFHKSRPLVLVAGGLLYYAVFVGLRGTGSSGLALLDRLRAANRALMEGETAELLASPHPLIDLLAVPVAAVSGDEILAFGLLSALAVSLALPAIWQMAEAVSGRIGGALAVGLFLGMPIVTGAATVVGEAAIVLLMWCWLLRLATRSKRSWATTLGQITLAVALTLSWAPSVVWLFAWLVVSIAARGVFVKPDDPEAGGMIPSARLSLGTLLAPLAAVAIPSLLFIAMGLSVTSGWDIYTSHSILAEWPPVIFGGETFAPQRPPLNIGLFWLAFEFPPHVTILTFAALILPATEVFGLFVEEPATRRGFELPRSLSIMTLIFLLGLPWALRSATLGGVPTMLLTTPLLAILSAALLSTFAEIALNALERREASQKLRRAVLAGLIGLFLLPSLVETIVIHPFESSYYNWFAGSLQGAVESGHPAARDDVLPKRVAESATRASGPAELYVGPWREHMEAYVRFGYLEPLNLTDDLDTAQARFYARDDLDPATQPHAKRMSWTAEGVDLFVLDFYELSTGDEPAE